MIATTLCLTATLDADGQVRHAAGSWAGALREHPVFGRAATAAAGGRKGPGTEAFLAAVITHGYTCRGMIAPDVVAAEARRLTRLPPAQAMFPLPDGSLLSVTADDAGDGALRVLATIAHPPNTALTGVTAAVQPIIDAVPSPISIKDADRRYLYVNRAWEACYGVTRSQICCRRFEDLDTANLTPDSHRPLSGDVRSRDEEVLWTGQPVLDHEEVFVDASGRQRTWVNSRIPLSSDVIGEAAILSITHDITERKEFEVLMGMAKAKAEGANRAKSEFISIVSHELRTPLHAIVGFAELCLDMVSDAEVQDYLRTIENSGRCLSHLIDDLLDLSRMESGRFTLEDGPLDVAAELNGVARLMEQTAVQKGLVLDIEADPAVPARLRGDRKRLRQILVNLVSNALKFTQRGGITVRAHVVDSVLKVTVADTGRGVAQEDQARIFEPFTQADGAETRLSGGLGLGLTICRRLVTQMGGTIGVVSAPDSGSTFWFEIPVTVPVAAGARPVEVAAQARKATVR